MIQPPTLVSRSDRELSRNGSHDRGGSRPAASGVVRTPHGSVSANPQRVDDVCMRPPRVAAPRRKGRRQPGQRPWRHYRRGRRRIAADVDLLAVEVDVDVAPADGDHLAAAAADPAHHGEQVGVVGIGLVGETTSPAGTVPLLTSATGLVSCQDPLRGIARTRAALPFVVAAIACPRRPVQPQEYAKAAESITNRRPGLADIRESMSTEPSCRHPRVVALVG